MPLLAARYSIQRWRSLACLALWIMTSCAGETPDSYAPPGPVEPVDPDVLTPPPMLELTLTVTDHLQPQTTVANAQVELQGLTPPVVGTTNQMGEVKLRVPVFSVVSAHVSKPGYAPTTTGPIRVEDDDTQASATLIGETAHLQLQTAVNQATPAQKGMVLVQMRDHAGGVAGIQLQEPSTPANADVTLKLADQVVAGIPRRLADGIIVRSKNESLMSNEGGSFYLLDAPPGEFQLEIKYPAGFNRPAGTASAPVRITAGGLTVVRLVAPASATPVGSFAADIFPKLQAPSAEAFGCAACHHPGGQAKLYIPFGPTLDPDGNIATAEVDAATTCERILLGYTVVVNPGNPDATPPVAPTIASRQPLVNFSDVTKSKFLNMPLVGGATGTQIHPNKSYASTSDPKYQLMLQWLHNVAPYFNRATPPAGTSPYDRAFQSELLLRACGITVTN